MDKKINAKVTTAEPSFNRAMSTPPKAPPRKVADKLNASTSSTKSHTSIRLREIASKIKRTKSTNVKTSSSLKNQKTAEERAIKNLIFPGWTVPFDFDLWGVSNFLIKFTCTIAVTTLQFRIFQFFNSKIYLE